MPTVPQPAVGYEDEVRTAADADRYVRRRGDQELSTGPTDSQDDPEIPVSTFRPRPEPAQSPSGICRVSTVTSCGGASRRRTPLTVVLRESRPGKVRQAGTELLESVIGLLESIQSVEASRVDAEYQYVLDGEMLQ
jgi:hypothetical protein